jgi:hypothetical protein
LTAKKEKVEGEKEGEGKGGGNGKKYVGNREREEDRETACVAEDKVDLNWS